MNLIPQDFRLGMLDVFQNGDLIVWREGHLLYLDSGAVDPEHFAIVETVLRNCDGDLHAARLRGKPVILNNLDWLDWLEQNSVKLRPLAVLWESFWEGIHQINGWNWQTEYTLPGEFENRPSLMWWVRIQHGDHRICSAGWNAVPPAFDDFCRALIELSGREFLLPDYNSRRAARR